MAGVAPIAATDTAQQSFVGHNNPGRERRTHHERRREIPVSISVRLPQRSALGLGSITVTVPLLMKLRIPVRPRHRAANPSLGVFPLGRKGPAAVERGEGRRKRRRRSSSATEAARECCSRGRNSLGAPAVVNDVCSSVKLLVGIHCTGKLVSIFLHCVGCLCR